MSRTAFVFAAFSWLGFVYALLHRPASVDIAPLGSASISEVGLITIGALAAGLIALFFAWPILRGDRSTDTPWLLVAWCAIPFVGMLYLLNPHSVGPTLP